MKSIHKVFLNVKSMLKKGVHVVLKLIGSILFSESTKNTLYQYVESFALSFPYGFMKALRFFPRYNSNNHFIKLLVFFIDKNSSSSTIADDLTKFFILNPCLRISKTPRFILKLISKSEENHSVSFLNKVLLKKLNFFPETTVKTYISFQKTYKVIEIARTYETYTEFEPSTKFDFSLPNVFGETRSASDHHKTIDKPSSHIYMLADAIVIPGHQVLTNETYIVYEPAAHPKYRSVAGMWQHWTQISNDGLYVTLSDTVTYLTELDEAFLLTGRCCSNYYHCLIEYFPKLLELNKSNLSENVVVIVDAEMPIQHYQALELLLVHFSHLKIYLWGSATAIRVKKLHLPSIHTFLPDSFDHEFWTVSCLSKEHLLYIRELILASLAKEINKPVSYSKKIYISRGNNGRTITNENEIQNIFLENGFEIIKPHLLSFKEQVMLFNNSDFIAGASGAGLSNILFCNNSCKVLALTSERNKHFCHYSIISEFVGVQFTHLTGRAIKERSEYNSEEEFVHSSYTLNEDTVKKALKIML